MPVRAWIRNPASPRIDSVSGSTGRPVSNWDSAFHKPRAKTAYLAGIVVALCRGHRSGPGNAVGVTLAGGGWLGTDAGRQLSSVQRPSLRGRIDPLGKRRNNLWGRATAGLTVASAARWIVAGDCLPSPSSRTLRAGVARCVSTCQRRRTIHGFVAVTFATGKSALPVPPPVSTRILASSRSPSGMLRSFQASKCSVMDI